MWQTYHTDIPPFISTIAAAPAMQRLSDVGMHCGCEYTSFPMFVGLNKYSRLQHSIGCALIVWHFTHNARQTVAALLHDIATPTFAHVVDFLNGDHIKQESTERGTTDIISQSEEIMAELQALGFSLDEVADYHQYPIADNDSPRLSADRLEYTLSNIVNYRIAPHTAVKAWYEDLTIGENEEGADELMFQHAEAAEAFSQAALRTSYIYIADEDRFAMQTLAELLKKQIERGVISLENLYQTEAQVIEHLEQDPEAHSEWLHYCSLHTIQVDSLHPEAKVILSKKRYINPYLQHQGRATHLFPTFATKLNDFLSHPLNSPLWGE